MFGIFSISLSIIRRHHKFQTSFQGHRKSENSPNTSKNGQPASSDSSPICHYDRAGVFVRFEYASEEFPEDDSYIRGAITISEQVGLLVFIL